MNKNGINTNNNNLLSRFINAFSRFLYRNKYGVLGTLIFHIILFSILLAVTLKTKREFQEPEIYVEIPIETAIEIEQEKEKEIKEKLLEKTEEKDQVSELLKSIAVNKDIKKSSSPRQSVSDMIKNVKENLQEYRSDDAGGNRKETEEFKNDSISAEKARREQQKLDSLQNIEYSGKSSVYYSLKGRRKLYLPIPVFKCENEGKVVVQIHVARNGRVIKAEIIEKQSGIVDECLFDAAVLAAQRTRFNRSEKAPVKQIGTITYHFIRQ